MVAVNYSFLIVYNSLTRLLEYGIISIWMVITMTTKDKIAHEIADRLDGTCSEFEEVLEYVLDVYDVVGEFTVDEMLDATANMVEQCTKCGWWFEPSELVAADNSDTEPGICDDCRRYE